MFLKDVEFSVKERVGPYLNLVGRVAVGDTVFSTPPACLCAPLIVAGYASVCPRRALRQHRPWQLLGAGRQAGFEVGWTGRLCG